MLTAEQARKWTDEAADMGLLEITLHRIKKRARKGWETLQIDGRKMALGWDDLQVLQDELCELGFCVDSQPAHLRLVVRW